MKTLFAVLLTAVAAFGQSPTSLTPFALQQGWSVGAAVSAGQIVKLDSTSGQRVVPTAAADSASAVGVAQDSSSLPGSVHVTILGSALVLVDNSCTMGQFVNYSATQAGVGDCSNSPSSPTLGLATVPSSHGSVYVHISPTASSSGGPILFAGVPTGTCRAGQTAVNTTNGDFYSCNAGAWIKVANSLLLFASAPTGTCTSAQTAVNTTNGDFYSCNNGVWNKINGGAAGAGGTNLQCQRNNGGTLGGIATCTSTGTVTTVFGGADWNFVDPADNTKQLQLNLANISTANLRTVTVPDGNSVFAIPISCTNQVFNAIFSNGNFQCHSIVAADLPAAVVFNNQPNTYSGGGLQDFHAMKLKPPTSTVSGLPAASGNTNVLYEVTDGVSSSDCTTGGGATLSLCASNGSSWVSVGGSGGGSGTVNSGSGYAIPAYGTAASTTVGPSNITTDSTDNNLNVPGYVATGTPPGGLASTAKGGIGFAENAITGWTPTVGTDYCRADSTLHELLCSLNGASELASPLIDGDLGGTAASVTVTNGSHITNGSIANSGLASATITITGTPCTLGGTCSPPGGGGGLGLGVPPEIPVYNTTTNGIGDPRLYFPPLQAKAVINPTSVKQPPGFIKLLGTSVVPFWPAQANYCQLYFDLNTGQVKGMTSTGAACVGGDGSSKSQKPETGADASLLSVTPFAAAGTYQVNIVMSVSAANTATLGATVSWKDSNGHAQAPTNISCFKVGTAAPALTFSASANDAYSCDLVVDVDNSGTAIVAHTTFSGTSIAYLATAFIKRLN